MSDHHSSASRANHQLIAEREQGERRASEIEGEGESVEKARANRCKTSNKVSLTRKVSLFTRLERLGFAQVRGLLSSKLGVVVFSSGIAVALDEDRELMDVVGESNLIAFHESLLDINADISTSLLGLLEREDTFELVGTGGV